MSPCLSENGVLVLFHTAQQGHLRPPFYIGGPTQHTIATHCIPRYGYSVFAGDTVAERAWNCTRLRTILFPRVQQYCFDTIFCGVPWDPTISGLFLYHRIQPDNEYPHRLKVTIVCPNVDGYPTGYTVQRLDDGTEVWYAQYGLAWTFIYDPQLDASWWIHSYPFGHLYCHPFWYRYEDVFPDTNRQE